MSEYIPRLQEAIACSIRGMARETMHQQPEGKWSTALLEHLYLTYTATVKGCERSLASEDPLGTPQSLKQRLRTFAIVTVGYFPRQGAQAPAQVVPKGTPVEHVVCDIAKQIATMDGLIARCELRHGKRAKLLNHPALGALTGEQWRKFHWVHGQHHVEQILALRKKYAGQTKAPGPPGA